MNRILLHLLVLSFLLLFVRNGRSDAQTVRSIPARANKLLFDQKRHKLYATVKSTDASYPNCLIKIDPITAMVEDTLYVGSDPTCMDITKDTNYIYVGLNGASFIKRVDLNSFQVDQTIALGSSITYGPLYAADIAASSFSSDIVIVSRKRTSVTPTFEDVVAFKKGVLLPARVSSSTCDVIESEKDTNLVFGFNTTSTSNTFSILRLDSAQGMYSQKVIQSCGLAADIKLKGHLVYSNNGKTFDPYLPTPTVIGQYVFSGPFASDNGIEADIPNNRVYMTSLDNGFVITSYNLPTFSVYKTAIVTKAYPPNYQLPDVFGIEAYGPRGIAVIVRENYFNNQNGVIVLYESCLPAPGADVNVKADSIQAVQYKGDSILLKYSVTNNGAIAADSVVITDTIPVSLSLLNVQVPGGSYAVNGSVLKITYNKILASQSDTFYLQFKMLQPDTVIHSLKVSSKTFECASSDNACAQTIRIDQYVSDMSVYISNAGGSFKVGDTAVVKFIIANTGQITSVNSVVRDTFPASLVPVSMTASEGTTSLAGNVVTWNVDSTSLLEKDTLYVKLKCVTAGFSQITAVVSTSTPEKNLFNNVANFYFSVAAGVKEYYGNMVQCFPNPFSDHINISAPVSIRQIQLYNAQGQVVAAVEVKAGEDGVLSGLECLPDGIYMVRAMTRDGFGNKIIIKK